MTEKNSQVTIGLPFYNAESTLQHAIRSIQLQSVTEWNLILIDDGSTDGSKLIAAKIADLDGRIRLISDGCNRGLVFRLNQLAELSQTKYLARMDADDLMMPHRLERQLKFLSENPEIDVVDSAIYTIDDKNKVIGFRGKEPLALDQRSVLSRSLFNHPTIMGRSDWFRKNAYDAQFVRAEDFELWNRSFMSSNFARIPEPLYLYREGDVHIGNYVKTMGTVRKVIRKYGKGVLKNSEIRRELIKTHLKSFLYRLAGFVKWQGVLTRKRNVPVSELEVNHVQKIIELIYK